MFKIKKVNESLIIENVLIKAKNKGGLTTSKRYRLENKTAKSKNGEENKNFVRNVLQRPFKS